MKSCAGRRVVAQPFLALVLLYFLVGASPVRSSTTRSRTFHSAQSYAVYPQWLASAEGICEFQFRTSQGNGILLYIDGNGEQPIRYLFMELRDGQIHVEISVGAPEQLRGSFGECLNDNNLHTITVTHSSKEFVFRLNDSIAVVLQYDLHFSFESRSRTFFGQLPPTHIPDLLTVLMQVGFIGCLEDIEFANDTSDAFSLRYQPPLSSTGVTEGCADPCGAQGSPSPCLNGGVCLTLWEGEGTALCDCRGASPKRVGQRCAEGISDHQLQLSGDAYFCYTLPPNEPYTGEENTARVRLVPPLPTEGTIMTGVSSPPAHGFFGIYLRNRRITLELRTGNTLIAQLAFQETLLSNVAYQLDYEQRSDYIELTIWRVNPGGVVLINRMSEILQTSEFVFSDVCVGGGLLENVNYQGTLEYIFFRHYALAEEQNIELLNRSNAEKSDVIRFVEAISSPPLTLTSVGFGEWNLSFEVRSDPLDTGFLVSSESLQGNGSMEFGFVKFGATLFAIGPSSEPMYLECGELLDSNWHRVDINTLYIGSGDGSFRGLVISVDGIEACNMTNSTFRPKLVPLLGASFAFGKTSEPSSGSFTVSIPFVGCLRDITFQRDSTVFRPNLEAAAREEDRFDSTGCFYCSDDGSQPALPCQNGGSCLFNRGSDDIECSCPNGFFGPTCEGTGVQPSAMPSPTTITTTQTPTEIGLGTGVTVLHSLVTGTVGPPTPTPTSALPTHPSTSPGSVGTELPTTKRQSESNDSPTAVEISTWVAIGVGSILVIVLITVISVLLYFIYRRTTSKERGFYKTEESEAAIPRYSASLQKVSSQSVSSSASNGNAYVATDRSRDREYFI